MGQITLITGFVFVQYVEPVSATNGLLTWTVSCSRNGDMFEMEMDDQCCEAYYPQFLWPWPAISMTATSPPLETVTIATKLSESRPLVRTNKDSRVPYPEQENTSSRVHFKALSKKAFLLIILYMSKPDTLTFEHLWIEDSRQRGGKSKNRAMAGRRTSSDVLTSLLIRIYRVQGRRSEKGSRKRRHIG